MEISGSQTFGTPHSKRSLKANVEPRTVEQGTDSDTLELPTTIQLPVPNTSPVHHEGASPQQWIAWDLTKGNIITNI